MTIAARNVTVTADGEHAFTAATIAHERWNGWLIPAFTHAEVEHIAASLENPEMIDSGAITWDAAAEVFVLTSADDEPDIIAGVVDPGTGERLYSVGAWNWCWSEVDTQQY